MLSTDEQYMAVALRLAERGRGQTSPNPMVGALVVTDDGVRVGLGYHARAGEPHAEVHALRMAGERARGATLYCTLEPCSHTGRTGPCCVAVADAGIRRVVIAMRDPNPLVGGRGVAYLGDKGIAVTEGVLAREAEELNRPFATAMRLGRPWVLLKVATSADARVGVLGARTALTSHEANRAVHRWRAEVDAIAVGSETVVVDDPRLTARGVYRDRPLVRIIFDTRLRTPPEAAIFATRGSGPIWIVTDPAADERSPALSPSRKASAGGPRPGAGGQTRLERAERLRRAGAEILVAPTHDIMAAARAIGARDIRSMIVEGGPTLHRAFWDARVVDRVQVFVTPAVLGASGLPWAMPGEFSLAALARPASTPLGPDVMVEGDVYWTD